jgi:phage terminase large subunit
VKISELIKPTDRQRECLAALRRFRFVLYGGAMGGGKSFLLRWWCVRQCLYYHAKYGVKGVRVGLFSMDFPTLKDRQISKMQYEFPEWLGKVADTQSEGFIFKLKDRFGGGIIALRNLDDASKYKSAEFASIGVEELTENAEDVFHKLRNRMRWPGIPTQDTHFLGCTNPGGPGHAWVKRLWIEKDIPPNLEALRKEFVYIQAKASDNPHIDEEYKRQNLDTLPEDMRRAFAEGDWDLFEGQYFSEWRAEVHVCEPFEIPWFWKIERCGDWGEANPCAHLWVATNPEGQKYVVGEVYGAGLSIEKQAELIHAFEAGKTIAPYGILDGACWDASGRPKSIADQFAEYKVRWLPSEKGPGSRVAGWRVLRSLLSFDRDESGKVTRQPKLKVFSTCKHLARTLPSLVHDKLKPEDLDSNGEDHACDALRYHLRGSTQAPETPVSTLPEEEAAFLAQADKKYSERFK